MRQVPSANVKEMENKSEVEPAVPCMDKKDFKIEIESNVLTISAEKKEEKSEEKHNFTRREFSYNSFARSFELPVSVNADAVDARYVDGLLTFSHPKKKKLS